MMSLLLKELECSIDDIYEPHELNYQDGKSNETKERKVAKSYHLTVDLPPEAKEFLKGHLRELGYKDITDWINRCYEKLKRQYAEMQKDSPNQHADQSN
jgi:thiamine pyrophosphate-dependent acetolactate synthase large subunit-like protein